MEIHLKEGFLTFARIERKTPVLRPALQLNQSSWCDFHGSRYRGGGEPISQIVCIKEAVDGSRLGRGGGEPISQIVCIKEAVDGSRLGRGR